MPWCQSTRSSVSMVLIKYLLYWNNYVQIYCICSRQHQKLNFYGKKWHICLKDNWQMPINHDEKKINCILFLKCLQISIIWLVSAPRYVNKTVPPWHRVCQTLLHVVYKSEVLGPKLPFTACAIILLQLPEPILIFSNTAAEPGTVSQQTNHSNIGDPFQKYLLVLKCKM